MDLNKRIELFKKNNEIFIIKNDYCETYMDDKIEKILNNTKLKSLGKGAKGVIYKLEDTKNGITLSIKVMLVDDIILKNRMNLKFQRWKEVSYLLSFKKDILKNRIFNLPLTYGYHDCNLSNFKSIVLYYEYFDDILKNWMLQTKTKEDWYSFVLQIFMTIKFLREKYKMTHNDISLVNIMFNRVEKGGHFKYITNNYNIYVPNTGYQYILWDFGSAKSYHQKMNSTELKYYNDNFVGKKDQKFILELPKRIRVFHIINRFTLDELKKFFKTKEQLKYLKATTEETTNKLKKINIFDRFDHILSKSLAFYLVETGHYEKLINIKKDNIFNRVDELALPPKEIEYLINLMLDNDYNSDIDELIDKYFKIFKNKKEDIVETINISVK